MIGYCLRCRRKREMKNIKKEKIGKRNIAKGICAICGTKMRKFI